VIFPYMVEIILNIYFKLVRVDACCKRTFANTNDSSSKISGYVFIFPSVLMDQFRLLNINLGTCSALIRLNKLIIIDKKRKIVFRCSSSDSGIKSIINNYSSLKKMMFDRAPRPLFFKEVDGFVISAESLLDGLEVDLHELTEATMSEIFEQIAPYYNANLSVRHFSLIEELNYYDKFFEPYCSLWIEKLTEIKCLIVKINSNSSERIRVCKTLIHGDLTYRNVLFGENGFLFYDFERESFSYPEFDIYLFYIDWLTHLNGPSYKGMIDNIFKFIRNEVTLQSVNISRIIGHGFERNREVGNILKYVFLYRMTVLSLGNFEENEIFVEEILHLIIKELEIEK